MLQTFGLWLLQWGGMPHPGHGHRPSPLSPNGPPWSRATNLFGVMVWGCLVLLAQSRFPRTTRTASERLIVWGFRVGFAGEVLALALAATGVRVPGMLRPIVHLCEFWIEYTALILLIGGFLSYLSRGPVSGARYLRFAAMVHTLVFLSLAGILIQTPGLNTILGMTKPGTVSLLLWTGIILCVVGARLVMRSVEGVHRWVFLGAIGFFVSAGLVRLVGMPPLSHLFPPLGGAIYHAMATAIGGGLFGYLCVFNPSTLRSQELELLDQRVRERTADLEATLEELAVANSKLVEQSTIDGLTGVRNRRFFNEALAQEWARSYRDGRHLAVALVDLDGFKAINDRHGHPKGDECLVFVASVLQGRARRPADIVARYGGDEFVVLLPDTDEVGALETLNTARTEIEEWGGRIGTSVTVSVGVASRVPVENTLPEELIKHADQCLYTAKQMGRNIVFASPVDGSPLSRNSAREYTT